MTWPLSLPTSFSSGSPGARSTRRGARGRPGDPRRLDLTFLADPGWLGVDVHPVVTDEAAKRDPLAFASSTARLDGAPTATRTGQPATAAFWTSSKDARPLTRRIEPANGSRPSRKAHPTTLSIALCLPTSFACAEEPTVGVEKACRAQPACLGEARLPLPEPAGERGEQLDGNAERTLDRGGLDPHRQRATLPQTPHEELV